MKWPHKKFIQSLLCEKLPVDILVEHLTRWQLPIPGPGDDLKSMNKELIKYDPPYFYKKRKELIWENMEPTKLEPMWAYYFKRPTEHDVSYLKTTFELLDNMQVRNLLFAMALSGMPADDIDLVINGKFDVNASSQSIDAFLFYFFNLEDFNYNDKRILIDEFAKDIPMKRALKLGISNDRNYMLWKLGAAPDKSFDQMLTDMLSDCYYTFKEKAKTDPDTATKFGQLAVRLADRLERVIQNEQKADDLFSSVQFDIQNTNETKQIPTADDIGAEVGGKIEDYEIKTKGPDFKTLDDLNAELPSNEIKSIDPGDYDG